VARPQGVKRLGIAGQGETLGHPFRHAHGLRGRPLTCEEGRAHDQVVEVVVVEAGYGDARPETRVGRRTLGQKQAWRHRRTEWGVQRGGRRQKAAALQGATLEMAVRQFWGWPPAGHRRVGHGIAGPSNTLGCPWPPLPILPWLLIETLRLLKETVVAIELQGYKPFEYEAK
jgi:hypothetical protein